MSLVDEAETAIGAVTGASWWRLALKLTPWIITAGLLVGLLLTRATLARVRLEHRAELAERARADAQRASADAGRLAQATTDFAARTAALQPLVVHSTDTVRTYAETPAGRAACLGPDRVRGLDELDASLVAAAPAGGDRGLPTDAGAPPAGR